MKVGLILVLAASEYQRTEIPDFAESYAPEKAVAVGGTGKCAGARGTATTKKHADGTCRHTFMFMD